MVGRDPGRPREAIGWPLLPVPDGSGRLRYPDLESSVRQHIEVILMTRPGERLMRPRFGGGLEAFVHEPNTLTTRRSIQESVVDSLNRWEPRIRLDRVDVWEIPDRATEVRVEIAYRIRRTGAARQLALRMEVAGGG